MLQRKIRMKSKKIRRGSTKKTLTGKLSKRFSRLKKQQRTALLLTGLGVFGVVAIGLIIWTGFFNKGAQYGFGADGFNVSELSGADLGIANVVGKRTVTTEVGSLAKSVDDADVSHVLNLNGNKGQTSTFNFVSQAGTSCSFYVDVLNYKSQAAYDADNVFNGTGDAGMVGQSPARYMPAATVGFDREYALLVTKGTKSYKFAITQPQSNITISEVTAQDALKRIAEKANL